MKKEEVYDYLNKNNISFEVYEHPAVYNMSEIENLEFPHPESSAKNLFICDDKKQNYYLITVKGDKRVDLKALKNKYNTRPLKFASIEDLESILKLTPGSATPLGLLNDTSRNVTFILDSYFLKETDLIAVHPNDNTATIFLNTNDLIKVIKLSEHNIDIIDL